MTSIVLCPPPCPLTQSDTLYSFEPKKFFGSQYFKCQLENLSVALLSKGCPPPKVVFQQRSSSTEGRLPLKIVFHYRSSSPKGILLRRASSTEGHLPLKVVFHRRLRSRYVAFVKLIHLNDLFDIITFSL